jgi:hypothetical protein
MSNSPCGICVVNAVRQGVDYGSQAQEDIIGSKYAGGEIHEAITLLGGTACCWYHADDAAKAVAL